MTTFMLQLPQWMLIRGFGLLSFLLLTLGIGLGIAIGFRFWSGKRKKTIYKLHMIFTISAMAIGMLHGAITVIDTYMPFSWSEVLIPFTAKHSPLLNGFGTLAGYIMLILIFTTDIRNKLKSKLWYLIHLLSYPAFIMAFIHGYYLGTDSSLPAIKWMYGSSLLLILLLTLIVAFSQAKPEKTAHGQARRLKHSPEKAAHGQTRRLKQSPGIAPNGQSKTAEAQR